MKKENFIYLLLGVSYATYDATQRLSNVKLPSNFLFDVFLNVSLDGGEGQNFQLYPNDESMLHKNITYKEVVELLCRDSKIPVWIDISVGRFDNMSTIFELHCSGRYSVTPTDFYYEKRGTGPFGIKIKSLHQKL